MLTKNITNDVHIVTSKVQDSESEFANETELKNLRQFDTYREVKNDGQLTLTTRWVITKKDGKAKARLVVGGGLKRILLCQETVLQ